MKRDTSSISIRTADDKRKSLNLNMSSQALNDISLKTNLFVNDDQKLLKNQFKSVTP